MRDRRTLQRAGRNLFRNVRRARKEIFRRRALRGLQLWRGIYVLPTTPPPPSIAIPRSARSLAGGAREREKPKNKGRRPRTFHSFAFAFSSTLQRHRRRRFDRPIKLYLRAKCVLAQSPRAVDIYILARQRRVTQRQTRARPGKILTRTYAALSQ